MNTIRSVKLNNLSDISNSLKPTSLKEIAQ